MAAFIRYGVTAAGINIIAQGEAGKKVVFTRVVLGEGFLAPDQDLDTIAALVNPVVFLDVTGVKLIGSGLVEIQAPFSNAAMNQGFFYRELGLYAIDSDTQEEVLFCYGNAEDKAEWIPPTETATVVEKIIKIITLIGKATNVVAKLSSGIYVSQEELDDHVNDPNAHPDIRTYIIDAVAAHNVDPSSHPDIRALLDELSGRIGRLEDMILYDVTGNPFLITFGNLDGVIVSGVWNRTQQRIEF